MIKEIFKKLKNSPEPKQVDSLFEGKTEDEIAEMRRLFRYTPEEIKELDEMAKEFVEGLNRGAEK
jgi:hypothetical protein